MYPQHFVDLLKQWLADVAHPGIDRIRTCAEIGRHEQPHGVAIGLGQGWTLVVQVIRTSPAGGDHDRPAPVPEVDRDHPTCRTNRAAFEQEAAAHKGPRSQRPPASVDQVLAVVLAAINRTGHDGITAAKVSARDGAAKVLRVACADGSTLYGLPAGFISPSSTDYTHAAHAIPKEFT